jgi:diadenosine tetraphosphate (Ap4A) HIT family hydrolase
MPNCVFCEIVNGQNAQKERIINVSKGFISLLVSHPETKGHSIIFTKKHYSELSEMTDKIGNLMIETYNEAERIINKLHAKAYVLKLNNNIYRLEINPNHVGHIHMHIIPRFRPKDREEKIIPNDEYFKDLKRLLTI